MVMAFRTVSHGRFSAMHEALTGCRLRASRQKGEGQGSEDKITCAEGLSSSRDTPYEVGEGEKKAKDGEGEGERQVEGGK